MTRSHPDKSANSPSTTSANDSESGRLVSLTEQILQRFAEALLESGKFDAEQIRKLGALATGATAPKPAELESVLQQEEPLE